MWYLFPTWNCNLNCKMCFAKPGKDIGREELSLKDYITVTDFLTESGYREFEFTGGEPLLRKELWEMCQYIHEKGCDLNLATNGTLVSNFLPMFEKNYFKNIEISLDSPIPLVHNSTRRADVFEKTRVNIGKLAELKEKGRDFFVGISTMILKDNITSLDVFPEYLNGKGVDYLCLQALDIVGNGVEQMENHVLPSDYLQLIIRLLQKIMATPTTVKRITLLYPACFFPHIQEAVPFERFEINDVKFDIVTHNCKMFTGYQALTPSGDLTGCCTMVGVKQFYSRNITELIEEGISLKKELKKRRNALYEKIILDENFACSSCEFFHTCKGSCRVSAYSFYGDMTSPDPRCVLRGELRDSDLRKKIKETRRSLSVILEDESISTHGTGNIDATRLD